jgi:hypothetical protein
MKPRSLGTGHEKQMTIEASRLPKVARVSQVQWHLTIIPATQEADIVGLWTIKSSRNSISTEKKLGMVGCSWDPSYKAPLYGWFIV